MQAGGRSTSGGGGARTYESDQRRSPTACFVMQPGSSCTSGGGQGAGAGMRGGVERCAFVVVEDRKDRAHVAHPQGKSAQAQGEADAAAQGRGNTVEVVAALALIIRLSCGPVASRSCGIVASLSCGIVASLSLTAFAPVLVPLAASLAPHLPLHHSVRPSAHFHSSVPYPCVLPCHVTQSDVLRSVLQSVLLTQGNHGLVVYIQSWRRMRPLSQVGQQIGEPA
ncbi:unnamed protein product [Closterium sp. NIES-54]